MRRLRDHRFRLFTLTDDTREISGRQLEYTGIIDLFERRFSVGMDLDAIADQLIERYPQ